jgi:hypothetical protein
MKANIVMSNANPSHTLKKIAMTDKRLCCAEFSTSVMPVPVA